MNDQPTYEQLQTRVAELETELRKRTFELNQRIRELKSVLLLTTAGDQPNRSLQDFLHTSLNVVLESMQYPEVACAELRLGEELYQSLNFRLTDWKLGRGLMEGGKMIGYLTVCYLDERPEEDFGPFTKEEKNMLVVITRYLVQIIRRKQNAAELEIYQRALAENQEKLNMIMENIPISITLMDKKGYFIFYNKEAKKNLSQAAEMLSKKNLVELFPREGPGTLSSIRKIFDTKTPVNSVVTYNIAGTQKYFDIHRLPLMDENGNVHSVMSISADITQQKKEEKLLRIQHAIDSLQSIGETFEESLRILFDNLFELEWIDVGGLYLANPDKNALELVCHRSLSPAFLAGTSVYPYDSPNAQMVFAGKPLYVMADDFPEESKRKINEENLQLVIVLPLLYQGLVVGSLNLGSRKTSSLDEIDKQALENIALKTANLLDVINTREMLSKANQELTARLIDIREKQALLVQKSKLESLGEIAAGLAHEINQPLSVISLAFENILFKLQQTNELSDYFSKKSETININIDKIRELIDHIRLFSRDQSSVMFEKVDLNEAVLDSISLLDIQLKKHHVRVDLDLCREKCFTLGNMTKMEMVVMNLLSNARDAVDEQAKLQKGGDYRKHLRISTIRQENKVVLVMEDNGTGISPENLEKIYNPFFTTKPPGQGTGLGLAMTYGIVTEMKGTIDITSELSKFTRVEITLPGI